MDDKSNKISIGILGVDGALGKYLLQAFEVRGYTVFGFSKRLVEWVSGYAEIKDWHSKHQCTIIINCIGATNVLRCETDKPYRDAGNILPLQILRQYFKDSFSTLQIISFSTDQVYAGVGDAREGDENPQNHYGVSKWLGDQLICDIGCVFRLNYVWRGTNSKASFTDWVFDTAIKQEEVNIFTDVLFNPVIPLTIFEAIIFAISKNLKGIYNLGAITGISKSDFYLEFCSKLNISNPNILKKTYSEVCPISRPLNMVMNTEKLSSLGFSMPQIDDIIMAISAEYLN